ncbi:MAG: 2OG-Fe(II) oxygenase, partial [Myxococcota bacterium]
PFSVLHHESLGVDHSLRFAPLQALFHILVSDTRLRQLLADLCWLSPPALSRFSGRIYRMIPWRDADGWHNDVHKTDHRLIALSLYLESPTPNGGELLIRRAGFRRSLHREPPHARGQLTVFRVAHDFEHKVARVRRGARTNFAGWYLAASHYPYRKQWLDRLYFKRPSKDESFARRWLSRS